MDKGGDEHREDQVKSELAVLFRELGILGPAVEETHVNAEAGVTGDRSKHTKERCSRTENQRVTDILDGSESERSEDRINDGVVAVIEILIFPCDEEEDQEFAELFGRAYDDHCVEDAFDHGVGADYHSSQFLKNECRDYRSDTCEKYGDKKTKRFFLFFIVEVDHQQKTYYRN